jgi:hypothetical protein
VGVLFDYFIAVDDGTAAEIIERDGGPGSSPSPPLRKGLFGRRSKVELQSDGVPLPTVADAGFDPVVQATTLEEILTGQAYDDISDQIGWGRVVASREGGERTVIAVSSGLVDALTSADDTTLAAAMVPWSQTEEFWGAAQPNELLPVVRDLAGLAREAKRTNQAIYCWSCV